MDAPCSVGDYRIYKYGYLLGNGNDGNGGLGGSGDNVIQLGVSGSNFASNAYAPITRWALTNPTGDSQSRYAYWMVDLSNIYVPGVNATRVNRHVIHFKSGVQDYVLSYDDVLSGAQLQVAFFHYGGTPTIGISTASFTCSSCYYQSAGGTTSQINSRFLPVSGQIAQLILADGIAICSSSDGTSCNMCSTSGEWIAVHQPSSSPGTAMPSITQPNCSGTGGNCTVVQIADPSFPKVAVFARQGRLLTGVSFVTSHSATAQYVVAGLAAGTYTITNGTAISTCSVASNDNTCYFETTSGTIVLKSQ